MYRESKVLVLEPETETSQTSSFKVDPNVYAEVKISAPKIENKRKFFEPKFDTKTEVLKEVKTAKSTDNKIESLFNSKFETEIETVTYTTNAKTKTKPKLKLSRGGKIGIICYSIITLVLGFAIFFNILTINNLANKVSGISTAIETVQKIQLDTLIRQIDNISNEESLSQDAEDEGYVPVSPENTQTVTLNEKNVVDKPHSSTNFFDKICNFILNFFGG